ncbi:MAG: fibronectin type III domain-containing protein, partial [Fibrobacter sp.]|nr:fibronectin type III domain-containing protein [Fibrobacter sp.]
MVKKQRWLYILMVLFISCADYELLNLGEPESVQLQISAVTDSTVSLVWSKSHDEDFKNYKLYYSRKETVDNNDSLVDSLSFRVDTVRTVRGLAPDTRYYFRVLV